jgi:hypothetical protein
MIIPHNSKLSVGFLFFLLIHATPLFSEYLIEGTVFSYDTRLPLDSVHIASLREGTVVWSALNGQFSLPVSSTDNTPVNNNTALSKISAKKRHKPEIFNLIDIKGRVTTSFALSKPGQIFDVSGYPPGLYLFNGTDGRYGKVLVQSRKVIAPPFKRSPLPRTEPIKIERIKDTLFISKPGYAYTRLAVDTVPSSRTIFLKKKRWLSSDIHNHTVLTDGDHTLDELLSHAFSESGLDVLVNSEHGGAFSLDTLGRSFFDFPVIDPAYPQFEQSISIPRWYSLSHYSWPKILSMRTKYTDKIILQGFEWNCPGHYHASVGFIDDEDQPDAISEFEYRFDGSDQDASHTEWMKYNISHNDALFALRWLNEYYPTSSYFFVNHPSRAPGTYPISAIRDFIAAAPDLCLGFEGMPGHQKNTMRGNYSLVTDTTDLTHGGADIYLAQIGGIWDALLSEGYHFWTIVNGDFHRTTTDFWPGEYSKTWSTATDTGAQAWFEGIRNGEIFIANGELITDLDFHITDGLRFATMGDDLNTSDSSLIITIRFKGSGVTRFGNRIHVDHIDLIAGTISGKIDPGDMVAYAGTGNADTHLLTRFRESVFIQENGWKAVRCTLSVDRPTYFRLRGTNLAVGTPGELTDTGEPMYDISDGNTQAVAWNDLWFYSNPIFVYPSK